MHIFNFVWSSQFQFYYLQALDVIKILKEKEAIQIERAQMRLKIIVPGKKYFLLKSVHKDMD